MKLTDLIIERGPFVAGDAMPFPTAPNGHPIVTATEINELRDELIELRRLLAAGAAQVSASLATETAQTGTAGGNGWAETQNGAERFTVEAISPYGPYGGVADISLRHDCVTWAVHIDRPITLAELNRRAAEHTEVCR